GDNLDGLRAAPAFLDGKHREHREQHVENIELGAPLHRLNFPLNTSGLAPSSLREGQKAFEGSTRCDLRSLRPSCRRRLPRPSRWRLARTSNTLSPSICSPRSSTRRTVASRPWSARKAATPQL